MASPRPVRAGPLLAVVVVSTGLAACTSTSVLDLGVGDCLRSADLEGGGSVSEIATVACDEPHDAEIFAELELADGDYPGIEAVRTAAEDFCLPEFEEFAQVGHLDSELDVYPLLPTADTWTDDHDREVLCIVVAPREVTGTMEHWGR